LRVLQCVAVEVRCFLVCRSYGTVLARKYQFCGSVLQCVAACCSVL